MATYGKTPNYKQVAFDTLKRYDIVPEDSMLDDGKLRVDLNFIVIR